MANVETVRSVGRPRCTEAHKAILDATADLMECSHFRDITVERIATDAGVGKQTIYRWYSCKADLLLEAFLARVNEKAPTPAYSGDIVADLRICLHHWIDFYSGSSAGGAYRALFAEAQCDPAFRQRFREVVIDARRRGARDLVRAAIDAGQLRADLDPDIAIDLIYSPFAQRFLMSFGPLDHAQADAVLDTVLRGMMADPAMMRKRPAESAAA